MQITKRFKFDAAHFLSPEIGPNEKKMHGHTYKLEVTIEGDINKVGAVMNIGKIKKIVNTEVINSLDHSLLNDYMQNPTIENIALWSWAKLKRKLPLLHQIRVYETKDNFATYFGD